MKKWNKARDVLVNAVSPVGEEFVDVDNSLGMMLAENVLVDKDVVIDGEQIIAAGNVGLKSKRVITPPMIAAMKLLGKEKAKVRRNAVVSIGVSGCDDAFFEAVSTMTGDCCFGLPVQCNNSFSVENSVEGIKESITQDDTVDSLIIIGGSKDHFIPAINDLDGKVLFDSVAISPGSDTQAGLYSGKLILRFPAELVTIVTLMELLFAPAIRSMMKIIDQPQECLRGEFKGKLESHKELVAALPVKVKIRHGIAQLRPLPLKNEQDIFAFRNAEGLAIIPADSGSYDAYSIVDFLPLPWSEWLHN